MTRDKTDYRKPDNWTTPSKAIRRNCLDCVADSQKLVRECHIYTCPLWTYRLGHRPRNVEAKLYDFPDAQVFEIENPEEGLENLR